MTTPLDLTAGFAVDLEAADTARRTITGTVVPYGAFGNTSAGPVAFMAGAFADLDAASVLLVREHDETTPLGRAVELRDADDRIVGTFRVARTSAGDDALVEAADGLRAGLSIGAHATEYEVDDEGRLVVTAAELRHVGLVVRPAYEASQVSNVAAAHREGTPMPTETPAPSTTPQAPEGTPPPAGDTVTMTASQLDDVLARAVDAALEGRTVSASEPPAATPHVTVNEPDITAGQYARAYILAQANGDADSQRVVEAALATSTVAQNSGVIPTPQLQDWIDAVRVGRPTVEALSRRPLPESGMQFELPRWVVKPITAETGESVQIATQATQIDDMAVDVVKVAGGNRLPVELVERSSPAYIEELIDALVSDFQQKTNAYAFAQINPARTLAADQHSVADNLHDQFIEGIADAYANSKRVPDQALGGMTAWKNVRKYKDTTNRPIYSAYNPQNSGGNIRPTGLTGEVEGLNFALETDAADTDLLVFPSEAARYYEQSGAPLTVRMMQVSTLEWEVAVYGFLAVAVKHPGAFRWLTDTAPGA